MRIALVSAPLRSVISDRALGYQTPIGLLMVGGPLIDAGFEVKLFDAARERWSDAEIVRRLREYEPNLMMVGHSASTKAHPASLRLMRAVKSAMPRVVTVYGGVHATFQWEEILAAHAEVDVIVRGEGEVTGVKIAEAIAAGGMDDLSEVLGIAWRKGKQVVLNRPRPPIDDLESCRIGWGLIADWDRYLAFGHGRTAVVQFSRGCPHRCSYCGQWEFWQRWRHRDVVRFVDELEFLHREYGIRFFWFADENPTTQQAVWRRFLEEVVRRDLDISMTASVLARDIVRDAEFLDLYRQAGFLYVLMGVETISDEVLQQVGKNSTADDAYQAVRLLRKHGILSIIDYIFGLERETWRTIWRAMRGLENYDSDFVNVLYLTPYPWTRAARETHQSIIEQDFSKWDCRHQIVRNDGLSPASLFLGIRAIEAAYHLRPKRLARMFFGDDVRLRRQVRFAYRHVVGVFLQENFEYFCNALPAIRRQTATGTSIPPPAQSELREEPLAACED